MNSVQEHPLHDRMRHHPSPCLCPGPRYINPRPTTAYHMAMTRGEVRANFLVAATSRDLYLQSSQSHIPTLHSYNIKSQHRMPHNLDSAIRRTGCQQVLWASPKKMAETAMHLPLPVDMTQAAAMATSRLHMCRTSQSPRPRSLKPSPSPGEA